MELRASLFLPPLLALFSVGCGGANPGTSVGDGGIVNTASCSSPATACGDQCVDTQNDPANCGDCQHACAPTHAGHAICVAGTCAFDVCAGGFADCDHDATNGCETPTDNDVMNCGACGNVCAAEHAGTATCVQGVCGHNSCAAGFADCDSNAANGCETSTTDDDANCGACGNKCPLSNTCAGGVCGLVCEAPLDRCGNGSNAFCTLTDDDPDNCGSCGHACTPMHANQKACAHGVCGYGQCENGWGDCDNDTTNGCETCTICDIANCGGCGIKCNAVHVQNLSCNGTCVWSACDPGWSNCDTDHENGCEAKEDDAHCGTSCMPCTVPGQHCNSGVCS